MVVYEGKDVCGNNGYGGDGSHGGQCSNGMAMVMTLR